jgi:hypothetical protein
MTPRMLRAPNQKTVICFSDIVNQTFYLEVLKGIIDGMHCKNGQFSTERTT